MTWYAYGGRPDDYARPKGSLTLLPGAQLWALDPGTSTRLDLSLVRDAAGNPVIQLTADADGGWAFQVDGYPVIDLEVQPAGGGTASIYRGIASPSAIAAAITAFPDVSGAAADAAAAASSAAASAAAATAAQIAAQAAEAAAEDAAGGSYPHGATVVTGGDYSTETFWGQMLVRVLPVVPRTRRWRMTVHNYNYKAASPNAPAIAGPVSYPQGVRIGRASLGTDGAPNGGFAVSSVLALSSFTTPADGSRWVSPWVSDPAAQFSGDGLDLLSYHQDATGVTGGKPRIGEFGGIWFEGGAGAAAKVAQLPPPTGGYTRAAWVDVTIEYEPDVRLKRVLVWGDSIATGPGLGLPSSGRDQRFSWPTMLHRGGGLAVVNLSMPGRNLVQTVTGMSQLDRVLPVQGDGTGFTPDDIAFALGANGLVGTSLVTFQTNYVAALAVLRAKWPGARIFGQTVTGHNFASGSADETTRQSVNAWLRDQPAGLAGVCDLDRATRDPANPHLILSDLTPDQLHLTTAGCVVAAAAWRSVLGGGPL